jgi:hypothetical protein
MLVFALQEIDGRALLLITLEFLLRTLNINLGPAIKICQRIVAAKYAYLSKFHNGAATASVH